MAGSSAVLAGVVTGGGVAADELDAGFLPAFLTSITPITAAANAIQIHLPGPLQQRRPSHPRGMISFFASLSLLMCISLSG